MTKSREPKRYKITDEAKITQLIDIYNDYVVKWNAYETNPTHGGSYHDPEVQTLNEGSRHLLFCLGSESGSVPGPKFGQDESSQFCFTPFYKIVVRRGWNEWQGASLFGACSFNKRTITRTDIVSVKVEYFYGCTPNGATAHELRNDGSSA